MPKKLKIDFTPFKTWRDKWLKPLRKAVWEMRARNELSGDYFKKQEYLRHMEEMDTWIALLACNADLLVEVFDLVEKDILENKGVVRMQTYAKFKLINHLIEDVRYVEDIPDTPAHGEVVSVPDKGDS